MWYLPNQQLVSRISEPSTVWHAATRLQATPCYAPTVWTAKMRPVLAKVLRTPIVDPRPFQTQNPFLTWKKICFFNANYESQENYKKKSASQKVALPWAATPQRALGFRRNSAMIHHWKRTWGGPFKKSAPQEKGKLMCQTFGLGFQCQFSGCTVYAFKKKWGGHVKMDPPPRFLSADFPGSSLSLSVISS